MTFQILNEILDGRGHGQVFKILFRGKECLLKMYDFDEHEEKISDELMFMKSVKHLQRFLSIEQHGKLKCEKIKLFHKSLNAKHATCFYFIYYPYLDGSLKDIKYSLNIQEYLNLLYQIISTIKQLREIGWVHGDLHGGNIMFKKKPINQNNGDKFDWYIIDYEHAHRINEENKQNKEPRDHWRSDDLLYFLSYGGIIYIDKKTFTIFPGDTHIKYKKKNVMPYQTFLKNLYNHEKFNEIKQYIPDIQSKTMTEEYTLLILYVRYYDVLLQCSGLDKFTELKALNVRAKFCPILILNIIKYSQNLDICVKKIAHVMQLCDRL
jgi:serine/threonine protein kinase